MRLSSPNPRPPSETTLYFEKPLKAGFTLLEMLAVFGIVALILGLCLPALHGMLEGQKVSEAAKQVTSHLKLARQQAITSNSDLEIRFYETPVGEEWIMNGMQAFLLSSDGTPRAITKWLSLPPPVVISSDPEATNLLTLPTHTPDDSAPALPSPIVHNYRYRKVLFQANGSLMHQGAIHFTLQLQKSQIAGQTVAIDAATGRIATFAP